jgi:hypothetical protein
MNKINSWLKKYWQDIAYFVIWQPLRAANYKIDTLQSIITRNQIIVVLFIVCFAICSISIRQVIKSKAASLRDWNHTLMFLSLSIYAICFFLYPMIQSDTDWYFWLVQKSIVSVIISLVVYILIIVRIVIWGVKKYRCKNV